MTERPAIVFTDIDGTLLNIDRQVSAATKIQVARITNLGIPFILISSRMPRAMTHLQADLGIAALPLIAYNGGLVVHHGRVLLSQSIDIEIVAAIAELVRSTTLSLSLYHNDDWFVPALDYYAEREIRNTRTTPRVQSAAETTKQWRAAGHGAHKVMCMGPPEELDDLVATLESGFGGRLHLYRSKDDYLEIADARISKLTGIVTLLQDAYPDLQLKQCLAFGDNYNDIEMLEGVGIGIAVANARPEVKAAANHLVATNKEDGVAEGLAKFIPG